MPTHLPSRPRGLTRSMNNSFQSIGRPSSTGGTTQCRPRRRERASPERRRRQDGRNRQAATPRPMTPRMTQMSMVHAAGARSSSQTSTPTPWKGLIGANTRGPAGEYRSATRDQRVQDKARQIDSQESVPALSRDSRSGQRDAPRPDRKNRGQGRSCRAMRVRECPPATSAKPRSAPRPGKSCQPERASRSSDRRRFPRN